MRIHYVLLAAVIVGLPVRGQAQSTHEVGVFAAYQYNIHDAEFGGIPVPDNCCRDYHDGHGNGYAAGFMYSLLFSEDWAVSGRILYADYSAHFEYWEASTIMVSDIEGSYSVEATFNNSINATIQAICIEPVIEYRGLGIVVPYVGCSVAIPVVQEFVQQEYLLTPEDLVFVHGGRYRNNTSGNIPDAPWAYVSVVAGLSGRIPVGYNLTLAPDVSYLYTLNDVMNGAHWQPHALRAGIGIIMPL